MTENEKKPGTKAVKTPRNTAAKKIEARLVEVLREIDKARGMLIAVADCDHHDDLRTELAAVDRVLDKARVIGEDGDLLAWALEQAGVK